MDWVKLVIPLIALGIWILSNILGRTEQRRGGRSGPGLPPRPTPRADERTKEEQSQEGAEELQRRIAEARQRARERAEQLARERTIRENELEERRKEQDLARRQVERPRRVETAVSTTPPMPTVEEALRKTRARRGVDSPPPVVAVQSGPAPMIMAEMVEVPLVMPKQPQGPQGPRDALAPRSQQSAVGPAAQRRKAQDNPALAAVMGMLRDRKQLASAFLLKEVLDKPLALRR